MLQKIRIQNFRSLKDVTLDLQQVNLLIGPNNSGKSNFLKAIEFFSLYIIDNKDFDSAYFNQILFREELKNLKHNNEDIPIVFELISKYDDFYEHYFLQIFNTKNNKKYIEFIGRTKNTINEKIDLYDIQLLQKIYSIFHIDFTNFDLRNKIEDANILDKINYSYNSFYFEDNQLTIEHGSTQLREDKIDLFDFLKTELTNLKIYKPDTVKLTHFQKLGSDVSIDSDASNLVSFLDNMRDSNPEVIKRIEADLNKCISNFTDIRFKKIFENNRFVGKKIGLADTQKNIYWAEELSEGTLYFLAVLSIIHQPKPPVLLLLEEPEKNVHPRRINEVIDYIFELAYEKNIQVILTTHNTLVVDEFQDIPEGVHIFEHKNNKTEIKNLLKDVIEPSDRKSEQENNPKIEYTKSLGEHWSFGFLGGVPLD